MAILDSIKKGASLVGSGIAAAAKAAYGMTFNGQLENSVELFEQRKISKDELISRIKRSHEESLRIHTSASATVASNVQQQRKY